MAITRQAKPEVIITGLRPNGELHLGSYLGAMQPMSRLQARLRAQDKLYMFVPDLHAFITPIDHSKLYENVIQNVRMFMAAEIDFKHSRTVVWRQSHVSAHAELAWILNCFTYYGEASRMTEFKDKAKGLGNKKVSAGLFAYPMLMGADILLYDAEYVPLGDDQKQHIELIRTVAERMNQQFGGLFTVPKPWKEQMDFSQRDISVRIRSLTNPIQKMSKSIVDPKGTISLVDKPELAAQKIMRAETDSKKDINLDFENQPGVSNLLQIGALLKNESVHSYAAKWQGQSAYGPLKEEIAGLIEQFLVEFQVRLSKIRDSEVEEYLKAGEKQANEIANKKLVQVQTAIGLY